MAVKDLNARQQAASVLVEAIVEHSLSHSKARKGIAVAPRVLRIVRAAEDELSVYSEILANRFNLQAPTIPALKQLSAEAGWSYMADRYRGKVCWAAEHWGRQIEIRSELDRKGFFMPLAPHVQVPYLLRNFIDVARVNNTLDQLVARTDEIGKEIARTVPWSRFKFLQRARIQERHDRFYDALKFDPEVTRLTEELLLAAEVHRGVERSELLNSAKQELLAVTGLLESRDKALRTVEVALSGASRAFSGSKAKAALSELGVNPEDRLVALASLSTIKSGVEIKAATLSGNLGQAL